MRKSVLTALPGVFPGRPPEGPGLEKQLRQGGGAQVSRRLMRARGRFDAQAAAGEDDGAGQAPLEAPQPFPWVRFSIPVDVRQLCCHLGHAFSQEYRTSDVRLTRAPAAVRQDEWPDFSADARPTLVLSASPFLESNGGPDGICTFWDGVGYI